MVKHLPALRETWVQSLGWEDPLEKEIATHSSTPAWKISLMEKPGRLQFMGLQKVRHDRATSHSSKVMLKILQARLQQYVNREIADVQAAFRKGRVSRDQIANMPWIIKNAREFQKTYISALLTIPKPLTVWITINCGKFWKRWEYQTTLPVSWETCMQVRKQQLELDL